MPDKIIEIPGIGNVAFPDSMSDDAISTAAAKLHGDALQKTPATESKATGSSLGGMAKDVVAASAPTIGGIVGGVVGGVPGAAVGGAAGQGYKQLISHATEIPAAVADVARNAVQQPMATLKGAAEGIGQGLKDTGVESALMAAGEGIGGVVAKGGAKLGKYLMGQAAGPTMSLAREFPELSQTMIDNALTVSKGGLNKARGLLKAAKGEANAALDTAHAAGAMVPITAATTALQKTFDEVVQHSSDPVGGLAKLASVERKLTMGRASDLTMQAADKLKTGLQSEVKSLYKQMAMGNGTRGVAIEAIAKADMAQALNQAIEDAAVKAGATGYKAANAAAQELIGATRAISRRLLVRGATAAGAAADAVTSATVGGALAGPTGAVGATAAKLGVRAAASPASLSNAALHLSNPAVQAFLRQLPKPALDVLKGLFGGGETP
jgi:hypothetical protein